MTEETIEMSVNGKTYKVIKLHGNGMCSCYGCEQKKGWNRQWTDWCYKYKGHVYCYECLMEVLKDDSCR